MPKRRGKRRSKRQRQRSRASRAATPVQPTVEDETADEEDVLLADVAEEDAPAEDAAVEEEVPDHDEPPEEDEPLPTEEQAAVAGVEDVAEEWPEWAYDDRSRRGRRARRKRFRLRRARPEPEPHEAATPLFDQAETVEEADEPAVSVSEDLPVEEPEVLEEPDVVARAEPEDDVYEQVDGLVWDDDEAGYEDDHEEEEEPTYQAVVGDVLPGGLGPRRAALHERRRKQRRIVTVVGAGLLLASIVGVMSLSGSENDDDDEEPSSPSAVAGGGEDSVRSMLVYGTREADDSAGAAWLALLSIDSAENQGSVVYIPAHTAVEVPGRGLLPLGEAITDDDVPLLLVSAESLLGIGIDSYLELSDRDARVLFGTLEPVEVDVPSEVSVPAGSGQTQLVFTEGPQQLNAEEMADLLFVVGIDGDDVELGGRHLSFWDALFDTYGARSEDLERALVAGGAVLGESDRSPQEVANFIGDVAAMPADSLVLNSLPVEQVSVGEGELYRADDETLPEFIRDTTGARSSFGSEIRVQILNGNGVPGIGDDVAELLVGEGFRVILSGNAPRLDYEKSLVITYERTDEGIALARRAKELLGVGEVQVSAQEQGIVDLTIVVGKDFLERN